MSIKSIPERLFLLSGIVFPFFLCEGQELDFELIEETGYAFSYRQQFGTLSGTNDFVKGLNAEGKVLEGFSASIFEVTGQSKGDNYYHRAHNYPYYGFGVGKFSFADTDELGSPWVLYTNWGAPLKRFNRISFFYDLNFGVSFGWKEFDEVNNEFNVAIGSDFTLFVSAKLRSSVLLSRALSLDFSVMPNHFSNGAIRWPNKGLNMFGYEVGLTYSLYNRQVSHIPPLIERFYPKMEYSVALAYGTIQIDEDINEEPIFQLRQQDNAQFASAYVLTFLAQRRIWPSFKTGFGLDLSIDNSAVLATVTNNGELAVNKAPIGDRMSFGVMWGFEYMLGDLSFIAHIVYDMVKVKGPFHQKAGIRYSLTDNIFLGSSVKSNGFKNAEFIEWSAGYRFPKLGLSQPN